VCWLRLEGQEEQIEAELPRGRSTTVADEYIAEQHADMQDLAQADEVDKD
jgi:hypothetical protein